MYQIVHFHMLEILVADPQELSQDMGIIFIGFVSNGRQEPVRLKGT